MGDTTQQAADDFFPGYAQTFTQIGKERGWPPTTRAQFDAQRGSTGALLIGDAETVAEKILYDNDALGGLARLTFQMGVSTLPHEKMLQAIEILGTLVAPMVRRALAPAERPRHRQAERFLAVCPCLGFGSFVVRSWLGRVVFDDHLRALSF